MQNLIGKETNEIMFEKRRITFSFTYLPDHMRFVFLCTTMICSFTLKIVVLTEKKSQFGPIFVLLKRNAKRAKN